MTSTSTDELRHSLATQARALLVSMGTVISSTPKDNSVWHFSSYKSYATQYNELADQFTAIDPAAAATVGRFILDKMPDFGDTVHMQQHAYFQQVHARLSTLCALLELVPPHQLVTAQHLEEKRQDSTIGELEAFLATRLRPAMPSIAPTHEKQVQDTVEILLIGRGLNRGADYDRETGRVKSSGKESVPDFVLPLLRTALEIKLTKKSGDRSRVVDEISADIRAYRKAYEHLTFVVYDVGQISDSAEFRRDFEESGESIVLVVKH